MLSPQLVGFVLESQPAAFLLFNELLALISIEIAIGIEMVCSLAKTQRSPSMISPNETCRSTYLDQNRNQFPHLRQSDLSRWAARSGVQAWRGPVLIFGSLDQAKEQYHYSQ